MNISLSAARARQERRTWYPPRLKRILRAIICFIAAIASLYALVTGVLGTSREMTYALAAIFVFFGGLSGIIVFRLRKRRPAVVMDANGLTIRTGRGRPQFVAWDSITDFELFTAPRKVLTVEHRVEHAHWADRAAFWRSGEQASGLDRTGIPSAAIAGSLKKVEAEIRRRVG